MICKWYRELFISSDEADSKGRRDKSFFTGETNISSALNRCDMVSVSCISSFLGVKNFINF
jgi:hypothetical protein